MKRLESIPEKLNELDRLAKEKVLAPDVMLDRVGLVIRYLKEINTIHQIDLDNYESNAKLWQFKLDRSVQGMDEITKYAKGLSDLAGKVIDGEKAGKPMDPSLIKQYEKVFSLGDSKKRELENAAALDGSKELSEMLTGYMHINFSRKRRRWLWRDKWIFRSLNIFTNLAKVLFSGSAGYWGGRLVQVILPKIEAEYLITMVIMIISFFSLDKWLDRKVREYFWRQTSKEVWVLHLHFKLYVDQIYIMIRNEAVEGLENV